MILAATAPLYAAGSTDPLGVFITDIFLDSITDFLSSELYIGKTGVVYVYENNHDLVAASKGAVVSVDSNGNPGRIKVSESTDSTILKSNRFLESQVGTDIWAASPSRFKGDALSDDPMQLTARYVSEELHLLITAMVPAEDYYGFIHNYPP